MNFWN